VVGSLDSTERIRFPICLIGYSDRDFSSSFLFHKINTSLVFLIKPQELISIYFPNHQPIVILPVNYILVLTANNVFKYIANK